MAKFKDRGCKAFPYRLTCKDSVTWHEIKKSGEYSRRGTYIEFDLRFRINWD